MTPKRITLDFETRSKCDLKKAGAYKYSLDPSTQPTCLSYKSTTGIKGFFDFKKINLLWPLLSQPFRKFWSYQIESGTLFVAHNAFFETVIYKNILVARYGWPDIPFRQWRCTAAKAAACALPRNLEGAGEALKLSTQKDKRGYVAMTATCKPTKQWNAWNKKGRVGPEPKVFLEYEDNPQIWEALYHYCRIDVATEELLDQTLPDLIPEEQEIWFLNQRLNWNGIRVDLPTVKKVVDIMAIESKVRLKELDTVTMGLVTKAGARQSILDFLALEGVELPDIRAKTVDDILQKGKLSDEGRRLLEIRKALSKTSTRKYQGFLDRAGDDGRVRDILLYHGASTGRDTGTGVQPHNFPRPAIRVDPLRPYAAVETVARADYEMLKILYGDSLPLVFSSILRNMIIPSDGCELYVADFSKIEVAVLWWLADNHPGLKVLNSGLDPYIYMASANTKKPYIEIVKDSDDYQLGKAQTLGCGFGMGWEKFQKTAFDFYRLKLTEAQSRRAVENYRKANAAVPILWKDYEAAAIAAIEQQGKHAVIAYGTGKCSFAVHDKFLWIELPSGRRLAYREPRITWRETEYGPRKTVEFLGLDKTKKKLGVERTWGGTLTENIVQAVARDLLLPSMLKLEKAGYIPLLSVHDEAICERKIGEGNLEEFTKILCETPKWADEKLPISAKGWSGPRYRK